MDVGRGIGRKATGCASDPVSPIYLVMPWPPGTHGHFSLYTIDPDITVVFLQKRIQ